MASSSKSLTKQQGAIRIRKYSLPFFSLLFRGFSQLVAEKEGRRLGFDAIIDNLYRERVAFPRKIGFQKLQYFFAGYLAQKLC